MAIHITDIEVMSIKGDPDPQRPIADEGEVQTLGNFIGKWRGRWPEWSVAEVFVTRSERERALAWATLQQELTDAAWGGSDPRPGAAKLSWWQEELMGWGRGARRHPLGVVLQRYPAPWDDLAAELPALANSRDRPVSIDEAFDGLSSVANAIANMDAALFAVARDDGDGVVVAATLLHARFAQSGDAHVPLDMLALAGTGDPRAAWANELGRRWPDHRPASGCRRLWAGLAKARLQASDPDRPLSPWATLWLAWNAARH